MKQFTFIASLFLSSGLFAAIEILDRVAVIVDDGVIMESQINSGLENMILRYDEQNIPKPPMENLKEQVIESLIIEELQLQLANRAGVSRQTIISIEKNKIIPGLDVALKISTSLITPINKLFYFV